MKMSLLLIFAFLTGALARVPLSSVQRTTSTQLVPDRFVVELDSLSSLPGKRSLNAHEEFYARLGPIMKRAGKNFNVLHEFNDPNVFVGASITLPDSQSLAQVAALPGVKAIRPVVRVPGPVPVKKHIPTGPNDPALPADTESTHVMTGVDKLHAQGFSGKGIKVGILDTGTDYTNPALGGGFGPGHKVAGGFDFVGDAFDGTNDPMPDDDPLDQCNGHGTHVAGIIGADPDNGFNISGVAFDATIFSYRIFGCSGSVFDDIIIEALLQGVKDDMDILTLSLGGADGWTEGMASVVASRLVDIGKIVTIAAGNDGQFGSWYTSGPGNGINVISVASVDNIVVPIQNATTSDSSHPTIPYFSALPLPFPGNLPIFVTSNDTTVVDDACDPLPDSTPDLSPFLVVIRRGTCTFVQKLQNVADKGGKFALIYDNGSGLGAIDTGNFTTALIQPADGQFLVQQFVAGASITVSFPQTGRSFGLSDPNGGLVSSFTSYGPTNDMFFKPAIAAPGGNILSTFPVPLGSFALLSGTSMATPFMAGSSALYLQAKGKSLDVTHGTRTRFQTTALSIPSNHTDGNPLQTLTQQGAGLVNVFNAIHFETIVTPGELNLNDTAHFVGTHTITVQNTGSKPQTYKLTHLPAGTAQTIQPGTIFPSDGPVPLTADVASVRIIPSTLVVPPHGSAVAIVTITPPTKADRTTFPVFTGFIQVQGATSGEILHVAYQGLAANSKDLKVLDNTDAFFGVPLPTILDSNGNVQSAPTNYTFVGDDFPALLFRLASGTPKLVIDLVDPALKLPKRDLVERRLPSDWTPLSKQGGTFSQVPIKGNIGEFDFQSRSSDASDAADNGFSVLGISPPQFSNSSVIPNGQYRILVRALKITGNPANEADYETFLSPIIGVNISS